jgi:hypothetical protein
MRRVQRQTGSTRPAKPSKLDAVHPAIAVRPGPFPWDRYLQDTKKPSNRMLRRSFGAKISPGTRKG